MSVVIGVFDFIVLDNLKVQFNEEGNNCRRCNTFLGQGGLYKQFTFVAVMKIVNYW